MTKIQSNVTRRKLLKAAGAGAAVNSVALGTAAAHEESLDDQLRCVTEATEQYTDVQRAIEDGYKPLGPFVPGMGWHFLNNGYVGAAVENGFDIEQPQLLTYGDTGAAADGELVLGAVEYAIPVGARGYDDETMPDLFEDEDGSENWHVHSAAEHAFMLPAGHGGESEEMPESMEDVPFSRVVRSTNWVEVHPGGEPGSPMFEPGTMIVADLNGGVSGDVRVVVGSAVHPDLWTLHAWVHTENPDGVFTETNAELPSSPEQ